MRIIALSAALLFSAAQARAGEATPLFASDEPVAITISAPWKDVARASPDDAPIAGQLKVGDETLPVLIGTRGKSRREKHVCTFPPLRIEFAEKPPQSSLFRKQDKLKLVTYCRRGSAHQQFLLKEYAAYKLYNAATPESFRARLVHVSYVSKDKLDIERTGFFIEDVDDLAKRVDREEVERGRTPIAMHDQSAAARAAVFEYMIGNLDWDMTAGPAGENCCHNIKFIAASKTAESGIVAVPYDFDMSGFVDAPYAVPPEQFRIRSVTSRVFRGFCTHNAETRAAAADFRARRAALDAAVRETPGLSSGSVKKATAYLDGFFKAVADDAAVEKNLVAKCRD